MFLVTCFLVLCSALLAVLDKTVANISDSESFKTSVDLIEVIIMLGTAPYFLFFCRSIQLFRFLRQIIHRVIADDR
jgi:hypothetical protein